jgi:hypothetical protein
MKKYLIGITILGVAITLFGYASIHGTPDWQRWLLDEPDQSKVHGTDGIFALDLGQYRQMSPFLLV